MSDIDGTWQLVLETPMGKREPQLTLKVDGDSVSGSLAGQGGSNDFSGGSVDGDSISIELTVSPQGQTIQLKMNATIDGDSLSGEVSGPQGNMPVSGTRI